MRNPSRDVTRLSGTSGLEADDNDDIVDGLAAGAAPSLGFTDTAGVFWDVSAPLLFARAGILDVDGVAPKGLAVAAAPSVPLFALAGIRENDVVARRESLAEDVPSWSSPLQSRRNSSSLI